jgi:hypothetical protein
MKPPFSVEMEAWGYGFNLDSLLGLRTQYLQQITHTSHLKHTLSITNNYSCIFGNGCCSRLPKSNHQEYGRGMNSLYLGWREVYFGDCQKLLGIGDWIGNLLKHLQSPKYQFFCYWKERWVICWRCVRILNFTWSSCESIEEGCSISIR